MIDHNLGKRFAEAYPQTQARLADVIRMASSAAVQYRFDTLREEIEKKVPEPILTVRILSEFDLWKKVLSSKDNLTAIDDKVCDLNNQTPIEATFALDKDDQCYTALGIIHECFPSIPGNFVDLISLPPKIKSVPKCLKSAILLVENVRADIFIGSKQNFSDANSHSNNLDGSDILYARLLETIASLRQNIESYPALIGHNMPPEDNDNKLDLETIVKINQSVMIIEAIPSLQESIRQGYSERMISKQFNIAVKYLEHIKKTLEPELGEEAKILRSAFAQAAGQELGRAAGKIGLVAAIAFYLHQLIDDVKDWWRVRSDETRMRSNK